MGLVALPNIVPKGPGARIDWELPSNTARFPSTMTGYTRTLERRGTHTVATFRYENLSGEEAARMRAFLAACRGQAQRFYAADFGYTQRGSFPASELVPNPYFASGTTGYTRTTDDWTHTAADSLLRATRTGYPTAGSAAFQITPNINVTQYAPYVARALIALSTLGHGFQLVFRNSGGTLLTSSAALAAGQSGLITVARAGAETAYRIDLRADGATGSLPGQYVEAAMFSLSRCALVDNGPNFTQRSSELDNAYWTKSNSTVNANAATAPDGASTADTIVENTAAAQHNVNRSETRTAAAADWCTFGYFKRASGTRNVGLVIGRDATNYVRAIFDLGTGTIASAAAASGDATNPRAFIVSLGDDWYYCAVVGALTATTGLFVEFDVSNGTTLSYTGDGSSGIHAWRCGAAQTTVPTRGMQTTTAGSSGVSQTGAALHLKGLPESTNGLLLVDDLAEIITPSGSQFVRTTAPLNSDAAGLGYWQFEPPLRESPADNAAVIVRTPMMYAMLSERSVRWSRRHAGFTDLEFTAVEDMTA